MRQLLPSTLAVLALICAPFTSRPLIAQQPGSIQHLAADAMSAADRADLADHGRDLNEAARVYGYNLAAGNWTYEQTLCSSMPDTILLHYTRKFPDGAESLFTALVPRGAGHVRIVPVLYRGATPFLPAPKNPRNYALFNELVPSAASTGTDWLELSACYAELAGGRVDLQSAEHGNIGIAAAPSATIHLQEQDKTARVTLATREGMNSYDLWSISLDRHGRVTAATTEDLTVTASGPVPQTQSATTTELAHPASPAQTNDQAAVTSAEKPPAEVNGQAVTAAPLTAPLATASFTSTSEQASDQPGWKYILHPAEPPSKIVPPAPPPPEKISPAPSDTAIQSDKAQ